MNYKNLISLSHAISKFVVGTEGNVSARYDGNQFLIKASGTKLKTLTKSDIVLCDGLKQLSNFSKNPSIETNFHSWIYENFDINYIAHTHPTNTLKILCSNNSITDFALFRMFPDQVVFNGHKSCIVQYAHPGQELMNKIKINVQLFVKNENYFPKLILLTNHGIICAGKSIDECIISSEICEKSAEIFAGVYGGKLNPLSTNEILKIQNDKKENYRKNIL